MKEILALVVLGIVLIVIGILNMRGNISTLKRRHRKRVAPADLKPFAMLIGIGTLVIGIGVLLMALFTFLSESMGNSSFISIGAGFLIVTAAIGLILQFYAMIKYNHGIF